MKAPTTCLHEALGESQAHTDFARLSSERRVLVLQAVLTFGYGQLLSDNGAAEQAGRIVAAFTGSSRVGDATARAVRAWARTTL